MAYDHGNEEHLLLGTGAVGATLTRFSFAATGLKAVWAPGLNPKYIRSAAILGLTTVAAVTKPVVKAVLVTGGSVATAGTVITTITLVSVSLKGKVFYADGLNTKVSPGQQVNVFVTTKATAGAHTGRAVLYVEQAWERPANNSSMSDTGS